MRRLPVYLLLDTSYSMQGEPLQAVSNGVQMLASTLRQDPYALETVFISIITFDSESRQIVPLTDLISFQPPELKSQGATALGAALRLLAHKIGSEVIKTTPQRRGDWKPIVFIMTDGAPTDDWKSGLKILQEQKPGLIVACAAGTTANCEVLKAITETVVRLDTADKATIQSFFKWVSASVSSSSHKIDLSKKEVARLNELPPLPPEVTVVL
ncbi:MAG: VWA domain-containing protein [Methylococcaceae bacterium]|nr:VWA domain-containing protein [Methylococcaceae bacterium]